MNLLKGAALATSLMMMSGAAQAADSLGDYGAGDRAVMFSYSLPFGSTNEADAETFALSVANNMRASINTSFDAMTIRLNDVNVAALSGRLNAKADDGYMPLIAIGVVVGTIFLVANELDDDEKRGAKDECPEGSEPNGSGGCDLPGSGF